MRVPMRTVVGCESLRIATAVEFLVVPPGKVWHTCQILGPWDSSQEIKTVGYMFFDFLPLVQR